MKSFLVFDDYSNYVDKFDYKGLKQLLIEELEIDTKENITDEDIVKNNFDIMKELTDEKYKLDYIKQELKGFGYIIYDLASIRGELVDFKDYFYNNKLDKDKYDTIQKMITILEEEMK